VTAGLLVRKVRRVTREQRAAQDQWDKTGLPGRKESRGQKALLGYQGSQEQKATPENAAQWDPKAPGDSKANRDKLGAMDSRDFQE
jgi:hypothetical protein